MKSKDPSTRVGAYIADNLHRPISIGFNGFPRGISDDDRLYNRELKYKMIIHAEANAIFNTNRDLDGATIYTYPFMPCTQCASFLIQKGIVRVVAPDGGPDRWLADFELAEGLFREADVDIVKLSPAQVFSILPELRKGQP